MTDDGYCILIPHYRHDRELARYLPRLAATGLPALIVDDGSDTETLTRLRALVGAHPWASLAERGCNGGKGAAMVSGMRELAGRGFTHVVSVDADGQHDAADIGCALKASRRDPSSVFSGKPVFGTRTYPRRGCMAARSPTCWRTSKPGRGGSTMPCAGSACIR